MLITTVFIKLPDVDSYQSKNILPPIPELQQKKSYFYTLNSEKKSNFRQN